MKLWLASCRLPCESPGPILTRNQVRLSGRWGLEEINPLQAPSTCGTSISFFVAKERGTSEGAAASPTQSQRSSTQGHRSAHHPARQGGGGVPTVFFFGLLLLHSSSSCHPVSQAIQELLRWHIRPEKQIPIKVLPEKSFRHGRITEAALLLFEA